jgi:hypothetical protein
MVGIMAVLMVTFAALAVDLGNMVARKTWTQSQADHAALAGGAELIETPSSGGTPSAAVVDAVAEILNANAPQQDDDPCWRNSPVDCVAPGDLTNNVAADGEVRHTALGLQVEAPHAWVDFGLAGVMGIDGADVTGSATVQIKTGGLKVMPMYSVNGCDWGRQTLVDPANSPVPTTPPLLQNDADTNETELTAGSVVLHDGSNAEVDALLINSTGNKITFSGKKWTQTKKVGFFHSAGVLKYESEVFWAQGDTTYKDLSVPPPPEPAPYSNNASKTVQTLIPDPVAQTEGVWWVRVWNDTTDTWSEKDQALPFRVGGAVLECASASNDGNFGTLRMPRGDGSTPADYIPKNIALGLDPAVQPTIHSTPAIGGECEHNLNNAVVSWPGNLHSGTNCVGTDPGVPPTVLDAGLVKGGAGYAGLLTDVPTAPGCAPDGSSSYRVVNIQGNHNINNEVLSCYLTNGTTSLADIASPTYSGGAVLDKSIYDSPRFFYVPILAQDPGTGAQAQDEGHSIIDFRPAFLTDEVAISTAVKGSQTGTSDNGLRVDNNGIVQMRVFFFNFDALPHDADSVIDYLGVGPRILRLVD